MFQNLVAQPADDILSLMRLFAEDTRAQKVDLGVGVYKDAAGKTPIMRAVKAAEHRLWQAQDTKTYVGLTGDPVYCDALRDLILGRAVDPANVATSATPGGTGALRQAFELIQNATPDARVFVSDPTWPNHISILSYLGIEAVPYRYFDPACGGIDFDAMIADLKTARAGDIVLLHGCCHNPTGADLTLSQWGLLSDVLYTRGLIPLVDLAYQGFGAGVDEDVQGLRLLATTVPECLIAASCSKNFGIYRERAGLLLAISQDDALQPLMQATLAALNRMSYSFPPDHGARVVSTILNDAELRADWLAELDSMRLGMMRLRQQLAGDLKRLTGSDRFDFLARQAGMFSLLGASQDQVIHMREKCGVYMVGDSRMNVAGLNAESVPLVARAIIDAQV